MNLSIPVIELKAKAKLLGAFACFVFLISIVLPFLQAVWQGGIYPEMRPGPETFWSFKGTTEYSYLGRGRVVNEYWFSDYWFLDRISHYEGFGRWIGPALIITLASQILVLLFSTLAIFLDKGQLFLCSIAFSASTLFCMCLVTYALHPDYERYPVAGFWLSLLATALFVAALLMSRKP